MLFASKTDVGKTRDHNEDYVLIERPTNAATLVAKGALFVVADGMGGHQAGEVASECAAQVVRRDYYAGAHPDPLERLRSAVQAANAEVYQAALASPAQNGMGSTIVAAAVIGREAYIVNVGDSRAYLINQGDIEQITHDHSFVGDQVRMGILTKEQARGHPQRHVITRALGQGPTVQADTYQGQLQPGDVLLLCSDGLTEHVLDDVLWDAVMHYDPDQAVVRLVELANAGGGSDNISVIVVKAEQPVAQRKPTPVLVSSPARQLVPLAAILIPVVVILVTIVIAALMLIPQMSKSRVSSSLSDLPTLTPGAVSSPFPTPILPTATLRPMPQR